MAHDDDTDSESAATAEDEAEQEEEPVQDRRLKKDDLQSFSVIQWTQGNKKRPIVMFTAGALFFGLPVDATAQLDKFHMAYKIVKTECKLVRNLLNAHGFHEVHPNSTDFNLMWTGSHLKPYTLRGLLEFQKINHFPRSYEITRKDRLCKNIQRMQHSKGLRNFDFIPESYVLPSEFNEYYASWLKDKGPWIVKPVASSRGRGIFLVNHPNQIPLDEQLLVCKYVSNPLLIDGFKFDVRLYVGVTSYDPLRIYLYEEGLTRFATVKYEKGNSSLKSSCMHLTNYSINKKNSNYVRCQDPEVEDYGNKWSMSAMLRYLKGLGKDTTSLMMRVEDVVIKTLISGEMHIATACKMFMPHEGNCFEIYGFDILIDENLKPWLLEVNLSPSMACDSPLDLKIKSNLISDMFNLVGFAAQDPMLRRTAYKNHTDPYLRSRYQRYRSQSAGQISVKNVSRVGSAGKNKKIDMEGLTAEEIRILKVTKDEYQRRGSFIRIFPSPDSWDIYSSFLEHKTTHNQMLHSKLFPGRTTMMRPSSASFATKSRSVTQSSSQILLNPAKDGFSTTVYMFGQNVSERMQSYETKMEAWSMTPSSTPSRDTPSDTAQRDSVATASVSHSSLVQGELDTGVRTEPDNHSTPYPSTTREQINRQSLEKTPVKAHLNTQSDQTTAPAPQQPRKDYIKVLKVEDILDSAGHLTKLQAREAFAMYLQRVQERLMQEITGYDSDDSADSSRQEEQIGLVLRFLKKAAVNLHTPFKVTVPSQKLTMSNRRRILAKQLGDFVHLYGKETTQIQQKQQASVYVRTRDQELIPPEVFTTFMATASETELEELLTTYTRVNKNASIFLGSKTSKPSATSGTTTNTSTTVAAAVAEEEKQDSKEESPSQTRSATDASRIKAGVPQRERPSRSMSDLSTTESAHAAQDRHSRHLSAVMAYGNSIAVKPKPRPASARAPISTQSSKSERPARPVSAKVYKEKLSTEDQKDLRNRTIVNYLTSMTGKPRPSSAVPSTKASVNQALQRLAEKQAARKYSANSQSNGKSSQQWDNLLRDFGIERLNGPKQAFTDPAELSSHSKHRHARAQSANATFDSFVNYAPRSAGDGASDEHVLNEGSSADQMHSSAMSYYTSQSTSTTGERPQFSTTKNDRLWNKQIYVGKTLSRDDYNKHMMELRDKLGEENQQGLPPHPPSRPRKVHRPVSAQRMHRLVGAVDGSSNSKQSQYDSENYGQT